MTSRLTPAIVALSVLVSGAAMAGAVVPSAAAESPKVRVAAAVTLAAKSPTVHWNIVTKDKVFFITIDDGWSHQGPALRWVRTSKTPVTSFVTNQAIQGDPGFFRQFSAFDSVQNHSMTHRALTGLSDSQRRYEICGPQGRYGKDFGKRPWMLRPPYGAGYMPKRSSTPLIESVAASCGITDILLWNVTVSQGGSISFGSSSHYRPGDVVLLHFNGDLRANLRKLVRLYAEHGLKPAPLSQYLPPPAR